MRTHHQPQVLTPRPLRGSHSPVAPGGCAALPAARSPTAAEPAGGAQGKARAGLPGADYTVYPLRRRAVRAAPPSPALRLPRPRSPARVRTDGGSGPRSRSSEGRGCSAPRPLTGSSERPGRGPGPLTPATPPRRGASARSSSASMRRRRRCFRQTARPPPRQPPPAGAAPLTPPAPRACALWHRVRPGCRPHGAWPARGGARPLPCPPPSRGPGAGAGAAGGPHSSHRAAQHRLRVPAEQPAVSRSAGGSW